MAKAPLRRLELPAEQAGLLGINEEKRKESKGKKINNQIKHFNS